MEGSDTVFLPHGGYENLRSYKVAEAVYDATVVFCNRFVDKRSRTHDQMVQAARSGVRNISEGSGAAATSRKSEMLLTNVARASLNDELLKDYKSFLMQRGLRVWQKDSLHARAMRDRLKVDVDRNLPPAIIGKVRLTGLAGLSDFVNKAEPELAANAMLCAINQACYLLKRQLQSQSDAFLKKGGFTESLHSARLEKRRSDRSDGSDLSDEKAPLCPKCGSPMVLRKASQGANAGNTFWGCSAYPNCKGIRNTQVPLTGAFNSSDKSDRSDPSDKTI